MTNAFFKQWVGILLIRKIDRARKNCLTPEIWEETHLREIFYGTLIFQQSSMICIGRHVGGHTLALQQFKCNGRKTEVIHNFKNHILVTWPATNLLILRKWCGFEKPNHYFLRLRYDSRIIFRRQNYITFIFIKTMSHDLLGQMAYFHLHFNKLINTAQ